MNGFTYDAVTEAIRGLKERGFTIDFNLTPNAIVCSEAGFGADQFEIMEIYRFEGNSDPADEAIVYAIQSVTGLKGVLVNGYGETAEAPGDELARKLKVHKS